MSYNSSNEFYFGGNGGILLAICKAFKGKNKLMLYKLLRSIAKNDKSQLSFFRLKASLSSHPTAYGKKIKSKQKPAFYFGGNGGIRTHDTLLYT